MPLGVARSQPNSRTIVTVSSSKREWSIIKSYYIPYFPTNPYFQDNEDNSDGRPPYTTDFLLHFCQQNCPAWVSVVGNTLVQIQVEMLDQPTQKQIRTTRALESLLGRLLAVRSGCFTTQAFFHLLNAVFQIEKAFQLNQIKSFEELSEALEAHEVIKSSVGLV